MSESHDGHWLYSCLLNYSSFFILLNGNRRVKFETQKVNLSVAPKEREDGRILRDVYRNSSRVKLG